MSEVGMDSENGKSNMYKTGLGPIIDSKLT